MSLAFRCAECGSWGEECASDTAQPDRGCARCARTEVERVEAEAASYRRVLVAVRDAMKATGQEPDGDDDPRRPLASLVWRVLKEKDAGADLLAEVERLRAELESEHANGPTAREWAESRAEIERLKVEQASWERAGVDALRDVVAENERLGAEVEKLRGLLERAACLIEDADDGAPLQCLADAVRALGEV